MSGCVEIHHPISLVYTVAYDAQEEKGGSLSGSTGLSFLTIRWCKPRKNDQLIRQEWEVESSFWTSGIQAPKSWLFC